MNLIKPKLLLVDDDRSVRESMTQLLRLEKYDVLPARDGLEAIEQFCVHDVNLVVLDLNLGSESGWEVFQRMTELNPYVPTIVVTAEFEQREQAMAAGVEALIEKPIEVPAFLEIVSELLAETSAQRLHRICGDRDYCRYLPRGGKYMDLLEQRRSKPLRFSADLRSALHTA
ncbi:MAG TPA: response regulator [Verrucomicrobiae bacterium]